MSPSSLPFCIQTACSLRFRLRGRICGCYFVPVFANGIRALYFRSLVAGRNDPRHASRKSLRVLQTSTIVERIDRIRETKNKKSNKTFLSSSELTYEREKKQRVNVGERTCVFSNTVPFAFFVAAIESNWRLKRQKGKALSKKVNGKEMYNDAEKNRYENNENSVERRPLHSPPHNRQNH